MINKVKTIIKNIFGSNTQSNKNKRSGIAKIFTLITVSIMFILGIVCLFLDGKTGSQYTDNFVKITGSVNILLGIILSGIAGTGIVKKIKDKGKEDNVKNNIRN